MYGTKIRTLNPPETSDGMKINVTLHRSTEIVFLCKIKECEELMKKLPASKRTFSVDVLCF